MSLRSKIALVLFLAVTGVVSVDFFFYNVSFGNRFARQDEQDAAQVVRRVKTVIARQLADLQRASRMVEIELLRTEIGSAGEPASAPSIDFATAPYGRGLHVLLTIDSRGRIGRHHVLEPTNRKPMTLREIPAQQLSDVHALMRTSDSGHLPTGIWVTGRGALLVNTRELRQDTENPIRLVVGRFLDEELMAEIRMTSQSRIDVIVAMGPGFSADHQQVLSDIALNGGLVIEELDERTLRLWWVVNGLGETPALLLRAESPRALAELWSQLQKYSITTTLLIVIAFPLVILLLLQWIVTGPLTRLTEHTAQIGFADDLDSRLNLDRRDEIGQLAGEFDLMLEKLAISRQEVVYNARLAGMADISTGVMHNVGNLLNSLKTSAGLSQEVMMDMKFVDLEAILVALQANAGELDEYLATDERGRHLLPFFKAVLDGLQAGSERALAEIVSLVEGTDQIANLVRALADSETQAGMVEYLDLAEQVDSAVELCLLSIEVELAVEVVREFDELPRILVDRHKLMDALLNLIRNALQSLQESAREDKCLVLRLKDLGDVQVCFEIEDNGVGIESNELVAIFGQGYTTKPNGNGLGLHLAANSAGELGGRVSVESPGLGRGATFRIWLPIEREAAAA